MKLPRTIRLDASDTFVFARAADPGEVAVTGSFLFWNRDVTALEGKERTAFRAGFLGVSSFGFSTLAIVQEATAEEIAAAEHSLAERLVAHCGAPDVATALPAAREEIAFAASLADHPFQTLIAMTRRFEDGEIREQFRTLKPGKPVNEVRAFSFVALDGEEEPAIEDGVDLAGMLAGGRR